MWSVLVGWYTVAIVVPILVGIGIGVMSMNPPEYMVAQISFSLAAIILSTRVGWWLAFEQASQVRTSQMALFAFVIFGAIGLCWVRSVRWVSGRRTMAAHIRPHAKLILKLPHKLPQMSDQPNWMIVQNVGTEPALDVAVEPIEIGNYRAVFSDIQVVEPGREAPIIPAIYKNGQYHNIFSHMTNAWFAELLGQDIKRLGDVLKIRVRLSYRDTADNEHTTTQILSCTRPAMIMKVTRDLESG